MNARDLSSQLATLLRREREAMADLLLALADHFDDKKAWRELGHTSLFYYLRRELGLSAGAAQHRKTAVELLEAPLTAKLSRLHVTVSREFMETLEQTKHALSHSHPGASTEEILMACMQLMLAKKAKQRGLVERPLEKPRSSRPDRIPAHVRRCDHIRPGTWSCTAGAGAPSRIGPRGRTPKA